MFGVWFAFIVTKNCNFEYVIYIHTKAIHYKMEFTTYYPTNIVVDNMLKADVKIDRKLDGVDQVDVAIGKKRNRRVEEDNDVGEFFMMIVKEYDTANLFPTFKTLVDQKFYMQLATHTYVDTFEDIALVVNKFKYILSEAEKALYNQNVNVLYNLLSNEMFELLFDNRHLILQFNLKCNKS